MADMRFGDERGSNRCGRVNSRGRWLAVFAASLLLAGSATSAATATPISLSGFNSDVISDANASIRFAQSFDAENDAWYENGTAGYLDGLPANSDFVSATGSGVVYHLQPADANNILALGGRAPFPWTGMLVLTAPQRFTDLYVIAASADAGGAFATGEGTINFADGTRQPFVYTALDWWEGSVGNKSTPAVITVGRNDQIGADGTNFLRSPFGAAFGLFEAHLAVSDTASPVTSITFTKSPGASETGVFGVSGTPIPEPHYVAWLAIGMCARRRRRQSRHPQVPIPLSDPR